VQVTPRKQQLFSHRGRGSTVITSTILSNILQNILAQNGADLDHDIEQASLSALSGGRSRLNAALTSIYAVGQPPGPSPTTSNTSLQPEAVAQQQQLEHNSAVPVAASTEQQQQQELRSSPVPLQAAAAGGQAGSGGTPLRAIAPSGNSARPDNTLPALQENTAGVLPTRSHE
jgi:hypothetical protein